jgi:hypothetical protein
LSNEDSPPRRRQVPRDVYAHAEAVTAAQPFQIALRDLRSRLIALRVAGSRGAAGRTALAKGLVAELIKVREALEAHTVGLADDARQQSTLLDLRQALADMENEAASLAVD